ncbi:major capsid protein [Methylopila sp. 73B]|uniref:major capsid protein n=1 Tax=Methylopila sp. 73B TaxID=1120792 RepID=UPI00035CE36B|nr:major capsid protein [Methylopila sp. 73B]
MATAFYERITQNTNAFNAASNGALRLLNQGLTGDYEKQAFFKNVSGMTRRDDTSVASVTAIKLTMDENISVKVKRKFGPIDATRDSFRSMGMDPDEAAVLAGQQMADETRQEMLNTTVAALTAAMAGQSDIVYDAAAIASGVTANILNHANMNKALAKLGDASSNVKLWVMNGASYHALIGNSLSDMTFNDSGISIYNGGAPTLGRPVLVTDIPALNISTTGYNILGLQDAAAMMKVSEDPEAVVETVTGLENLVTRFQGESAYNIQLKGFKWDITNGARNPSAAAVATGTNWDSNVTSFKSLPGVLLKVDITANAS